MPREITSLYCEEGYTSILITLCRKVHAVYMLLQFVLIIWVNMEFWRFKQHPCPYVSTSSVRFSTKLSSLFQNFRLNMFHTGVFRISSFFRFFHSVHKIYTLICVFCLCVARLLTDVWTLQIMNYWRQTKIIYLIKSLSKNQCCLLWPKLRDVQKWRCWLLSLMLSVLKNVSFCSKMSAAIGSKTHSKRVGTLFIWSFLDNDLTQ
jgi:hypothetical protein